MLQYKHINAPTRFVQANGIRFAYRMFGHGDGPPMLFLQHFRGGLDHWDPLISDGLARNRTVILFDNAGVAGSGGQTPERIDDMADHAAAFVTALGLDRVDLLGFSLGGYVAQAFALRHHPRVCRLVLVGTGPRAGDVSTDTQVPVRATKVVPELEDYLYLFFGRSAAARAAGEAFWKRRHERLSDLDPPSSAETMKAQWSAIMEHRQSRGERFAELRSISQPTLIVNGTDDVMIPSVNSFYLQQHLPRAQLVLYPDAGHAAHFQYPQLFLQHVQLFLQAN